MTRAADYAVRAIVHMASLPEGSRASLGELAAGIDVPQAFLSKVLQRLVTAGLLASRRGKRGGFELVRHTRSVSLLDVLVAFDGVPTLNACLAPGGCARSATCGVHPVWVEAQHRVREVLAGASLDRLARVTRARQQRAATRRTAGHGLDEHR